MVGDGANDAPALAYANASMAFASSFDIASQSADIINYMSMGFLRSQTLES